MILPFLTGMFLSLGVYAQQITVKGHVKDSTGEPVIGANVLLKGTSTGTITDFDGNFTLNVNKGETLLISFIGYTELSVVVNDPTINATLVEDSELLDDIVVIGYAVGSKRTVSGAIQRVGREEMNAGVVVNPLQAIKGKVAGVNIQKTGGDPTASPAIRVRGTTSLTGGNDPLVIIDGVFGDLAMLNAISPSDIESFTVLKDASETAQYGSRGASGVLVVTTIKGKMGIKSLSYDGSFGVETIYKNLDMLNAAQYKAVAAERGLTILDKGYDTSFIEEMQRIGYTQNHRVSLSSGNEDSNYRASIGMIDQQGIIKNNNMKNFTAKLDAVQTMFNNKVKVEFGMFGSMKKSRYINDYQKTFYSAASYNPTFPNFINPDTGEWDENADANEVQNPLGRLDIDDREVNSFINTNARITWTIIDGLKLSAFGSYTYNVKENKKYTPMTIKAGQSNRGEAVRNDNKSEAIMGNMMLNYNKAIDKHYFDLLALAEVQKNIYTGFGSTVRGFSTDAFGYNNLKAGAVWKWGDSTSYANDNKLSSFMGRFNYVYDDKYIATVNLRTDGSSKVGANNKWAFFPSASLAWVVSNEAFMKDIEPISQLKLRAGYGLSGNQDAISSYNSLSLMGPNGITTVDGVPYVTMGIERNYNPDLKWEVKKTFDIGFDLGLFDDRLTVVFDYYNSKTTDLLYNYDVKVPPFTYPTLLANMGAMRNTGVELAIGVTPLKTRDMELNINVNGAYQKNKLLSLNGTYMGQEMTAKEYMNLGGMNGAGFIGGYNQVIYQMVGQPVGVFYLPKSNGLIDNGFGDYTYNILDIDDIAGVDLADGKDRYIAGQAMPKVLLGANIGFRYKRFDLQVQMNGAFGHKIYNGTSLSYMNMNQFPTYNVMADAPAKNIKDQTVTDYWLENGDYLHFDYVTLGWNINMDRMKYINTMRLTFSVNNIATITNYSGLSPMINSTTVGGDLGVDDKRFYPLSRTFSLGLSVNF
jgi:TonB-linked SusC/RagA family outer membrane protein